MKTHRKYRMKQRAESQARTRERIVEAAVSLHQERGVKATTIRDIAERAGVERLTVYRHFPDELSLVRACSGHWSERNPVPDPSLWAKAPDAASRTRLALTALYAYYRRTEPMWRSIVKEEREVSSVSTVMKEAHKYFRNFIADLVNAWQGDATRRTALRAAIAHSAEFYTWQSFKNQNLKDPDIAELMIRWFTVLKDSRER